MKNRTALTTITFLIIILAGVASAMGLIPFETGAPATAVSSRGETIELDGKGLYAYDSVSFASQGRAQDVVTLIAGIPLLLVSFLLFRKGSMRASVVYSGTMGYFLYTYASYAFIVTFNSIFLVYTTLLALSLYGFILALQELASAGIAERMKEGFKRKTISIYLFTVGLLILLMWLARIVPAIISGGVPFGLEHYSTLGIQVLDLGIIVPTAFVAAYLLWCKRDWGYLLSGIVIMKALTMLLAIIAMVIGQYISGVSMSPVEIAVFALITAANFYFVVPLIRSVPKS